MMSHSTRAKVKRLRGMPEPPPLTSDVPNPPPGCSDFQFGRNCRTMGFTYENAVGLCDFRMRSRKVVDVSEVTRGYFSFEGDSSALHFVGVKRGTEQFDRMVRTFGKPDFVHVAADKRFYVGGEVGSQDRFVFANHAERVSKVYTVDDSQEF